MGADEICVKDMAGVGLPAYLEKLVKNIKERHPKTVVQYHSHSGPGFSMASILEVARAGADYIDVGMEPLSWGTGHVDVLAVQAMLKDAGFKVPEINMKAYMKVRALTQEFIDDFLGFYINPKNRLMNSLLIGPGLPGGMMGSLMADLENNLTSLNKWLSKKGEPELIQDDLLIKLFDEVEHIWPMLGYPPLVTPFSQYVKNLALMNVIQLVKGKERWSMIADNIWDMILGKAGKLPGELSPEIIKLAKEQGKEFYTGNPQDLYPDNLDSFREEMKINNWDFGPDDEELFELAMHPEQYRAYKSGEAKAGFEADLAAKKTPKVSSQPAAAEKPAAVASNGCEPRKLNIEVNGEKFLVKVSCGEKELIGSENTNGKTQIENIPVNGNGKVNGNAPINGNGNGNGAVAEIIAPLEGKFFLTKDSSEVAVKPGDNVKEGEVIGYIESMKTYNAIIAEKAGRVLEVCLNNGDAVEEDDVLIKLQ
jgi:pyruvate carboxylase subunit B